MRTHRLADLSIPGVEEVVALEPELDLYRADTVLGLRFQRRDAVDEMPTLLLELLYRGASTEYELSLLFIGVKNLRLPEFGPGLLLTELEIEDISDRMLEGIRFEAIAQFDRSFLCASQAMRVVGFSPR